MSQYNYERFAARDYPLDAFDGPSVGDQAPEFPCVTLSNEPVQLLAFEGEFLLLELGSITCPLFQQRRRVMAQLAEDLPNIQQTVLYVREAHPGSKIPPHRSIDEKRSCAQRLRDEDGEKRRIVIDQVDGQAHRAYGGLPNSIFIVDSNGEIVYRSKWNNASATRRAAAALVSGNIPRPESYFTPATPLLLMRVLVRAGRDSVFDFVKGLPHLVGGHLIWKNLKILFGRSA